MELSRQEYPALLTSLQPGQATAVLNDRIRIINKINADIADWLQERRRVEELYVQGLRKLARRPQLDGGAALGVFQLPWQRIVNATESLAASHETFAQKMEEDVERPLREYATKNKDLQSMPSIQNDLAALSKTMEAAQRKVDKAKEKGPKGADKVAAAVSALEEASQQWESRAPFVFEQLQAIDESRLNHLRDVLTQLQTHEVDQIERNRQTAESCLNALLNVQTADEIKTWATKINGGREPVPRRQESGAANPADLPPPPRLQDDAASQHSSRSGPSRVPPPEPRHTPLGGLRRLGTVMNRRKSIVQSPSGAFPLSEKKSRSPFPFRRGDSSREAHTQLPSTPPGRDTPSTGFDSITTPPDTRHTANDSLAREDLNAITPIQEAPATTNGTTADHEHTERAQAEAVSAQPQTDSEGYSERPQTIDEITRVQREAAGLEESGLNLTIRDQPIQEDEAQAKQAMDDMANTLRMQARQAGIRRNAGTIRGRRDVRNTVFIPPPSEAQEHPVLNPSTDPSASASVSPAIPSRPTVPGAHSAIPEDRALSDTTSIHSSHTLHSISGPVTHPELHEPGLNASIIETVNAWFSEGAVTKSFVVGELALAFNPAGSGNPQSATVRLNNFPVLEKVAANPHFVTEASVLGKDDDERRGEYNVALSSISRSIPTVAFKYQVHLDPSNLSLYAPIIFRPAWNLEEFQASVIIPYVLNPAFISNTPLQSITVRNLVLTVNLDLSPEDEVTKQPREVARATGAVMYPNTGASFRRKQSAVVWKLPELEVKAGVEDKFLVRFTTATSWPRKGKVEAKFEYQTTDVSSRLGISVASDDEPAAEQQENDPFADETVGTPTTSGRTWKEVPTVRKLVAGKYVAT